MLRGAGLVMLVLPLVAASGGPAGASTDDARASGAITLETVEFRQARRSGRPAGMALHVAGTAGGRGIIEISFTPTSTRLTHYVRGPGRFDRDLFLWTLREPLMPGEYVLNIRLVETATGESLSEERRLILPRPREGVVGRAWLSHTKRGRPAPTRPRTDVYGFPRGTRRVWAHFEFALRPRLGRTSAARPLAVRWLTPRLKTIGVARFRSTAAVDSFVFVPTPGAHLGRGNWRAWLEVEGAIVKRLQFRIG